MQINTLTNSNLKEAKSNTRETRIERVEQGVQVMEEHTSEIKFLKSRGLTIRDLLLLDPASASTQFHSTCTSGTDSFKCTTLQNAMLSRYKLLYGSQSV